MSSTHGPAASYCDGIYFWLTNRCPWEKAQFFVAENVLLHWGGVFGAREPQTSCQMLHHLKFELAKPDTSYPMFVNTGCGEKEIFICDVDILNATRALATAFIFGWWWMDVLEK